MDQSLRSPVQRVPQQTTRAPLSVLRTETVLSRFPIHTLAKRGRIAIAIKRTNAQGELDLRWEVSYNERYGPPRQLAYKLDTIVINQILDALPRPLPRVIPIGSLTHACGMLALNDSGRQQADLEHAAEILGTAIHTLLGLDLVDRLDTDLIALARRKRAATQSRKSSSQNR